MRLTAELIENSLSYLNPLKERELDLRGAYCPEKNTVLHFEAS
jgi:U2 small nuclear ribonucleoprotein A'